MQSIYLMTVLGLISTAGVGQTIADPKELPSPIEKSVPVWRTSLGVGYSTNASSEFNNLSASSVDGTFSGTFSIKWENTATINVEARKLLGTDNWGIGIGLSWDFDRKVANANLTLEGQKLLVSTTDPASLQQLVMYGNAIYNWTSTYVQFGLNYDVIQYTAPGSFTGNMKVQGGIGYQAGFGVNLNEKAAAEINLRDTYIAMSGSNLGVVFDYGETQLETFVLGIKYYLD